MNAAISATGALWKRELLRFVRQRSRWIGALATPLLFWLLIGGGIGHSFSDPSSGGGGYLRFFFPGAIALSVLFTAIFSTMSVIEDRHQGFLQGVLVAPVSRASFVTAKILGGASLGVLQALLMLVFAPLSGVMIPLASLPFIVLLLFLMAAALTAMGFIFAWVIDSVQGYHGVMNLVFIPMWILSGAVFPSNGGAKVLHWAAVINPLSYGVNSLRNLFAGSVGPDLTIAIAVLLVFFVVLFAAALKLSERPAKS